MRLRIAEENYRLTENEVFLSLKETFLNILQKQKQLTVIEEVLNRRNDALILIKLKYNSGRESAPAVGEAEVDLLQAEYDKMTSEEALALAKTKLNFLLGRPAREEIAVEYKEESLEFPSREQLIKEAKILRPEICTEQANKDIAQAQVKQARSDYFPELSLSSSYGYSGSGFSSQEDSWSAGVSLSLPIFNGFSTQAKVREAVSGLQSEDAKIKSTEQDIEEEVEGAYSNWVLAKKKLEITEKARQSASDMYQLTKLQYEQGRTSYFFLQQKELSLTQAEYNYINTLFNLEITGARLQKVWGK